MVRPPATSTALRAPRRRFRACTAQPYGIGFTSPAGSRSGRRIGTRRTAAETSGTSASRRPSSTRYGGPSRPGYPPNVASAAILVVDDDAPIRRMLSRTLAAEGYAVEASPDGGTALAAVERSAPDLVVLDVAMPGIDGLTVARRLRDKGLGLPILLLTARDQVPDRVAGLDAGADDYLVKPFAADELLARVRALLRRGTEPNDVLACGDLVFDARGR